ncbi:MAG: TRAP transporter small permease [Spirochaetales bacterium]|jgi:TRAP-type C4-dicarboxylate transport system permease small subunit|nr:TRAP transporter small permease [Spirochaetales bacterium]
MIKFVKIDRAIENIQSIVCFIFFAAMVILGAMQVFGRYVLNIAPPWAEELIRFSCIWMVMIGSGLTIRVDGHVSVDILLGFIKNNRPRFYLYVISRLAAVIFLLLFFPASIELIMNSTLSRAASLPLPYTYVYLAVPVGIVSMLLSYVSAIPRISTRYKRGEV